MRSQPLVKAAAHCDGGAVARRVRQADDGELFAKAGYVDWAGLMKRSFGFDVLRCPRCATKMRVFATITHPAMIRRILEHLGARAEPLAPAPARDPTWEQLDFDAA